MGSLKIVLLEEGHLEDHQSRRLSRPLSSDWQQMQQAVKAEPRLLRPPLLRMTIQPPQISLTSEEYCAWKKRKLYHRKSDDIIFIERIKFSTSSCHQHCEIR